MILKMGHLVHLVDVKATQLERSIPWFIESVILSAFTPLWTSIDTLIERVEACERKLGETSEVTSLTDKVENLMKDVGYLKYTYFTLLQETAMMFIPQRLLRFLQLPPEM